MKYIKWFSEGFLIIDHPEIVFRYHYKGIFQKLKLIYEFRNVDFSLYKDESSGVLSNLIVFLFWLSIAVFVYYFL